MEQNQIRNFCIISHIDHGKSTLADRFLEITNTIEKRKMKEQFLDRMDLEREKGITIKMQPVRMRYTLNAKHYILNLIDTPGHVDFSYEVSRSLAAVEGAILLVDATKGIQAQTLANLELAKNQGLVIILAVNKIDAPNAKIEETIKEMTELLKVDKNEIFLISAKHGTNIEQILKAVIEKIPAPTGLIARDLEKNFRALIFDSQYDFYKGVIAFVRVVDGKIANGDKIHLIQAKTESEVKEVGYFIPDFSSQKELITGEIGYIATGIKNPEKVRVGDTITNFQFSTSNSKFKIEPLPGYQELKPMVFASFYPEIADQFELLRDGLAKLKLNDASLSFEPETRDGLGRGYFCGFLGSLHAEIVSERFRREFGLNLTISIPSVIYKIIDKKDKEHLIYSAQDWPDQSQIKESAEPWVRVEVITPQDFFGPVSELLKSLSGNYIETKYFSSARLILTYEVPFKKIITGFYDKLKSQSQGFASMNYRKLGYRKADLVKLEILIAGKKEEVFSRIVSSKEAIRQGKRVVEKLKEFLPAQLFSVPLQAMISGKIIARETIRAKGKDVIASLYGGDYTRKKKLLEKQKKGKKALKQKGEVHIPQNVFLRMFQV